MKPEINYKKKTKHLTLYLTELEKEKIKPQVSRKNEIKKIKTKINERETKKITKKINEINSWFFEKINKTDKPLARLNHIKGEKVQINKNGNEREEITTDSKEIQSIIRYYYVQLYSHKLDKLEELDKLLDIYNLPRLDHKEIQNLNRPINSKEK